MFHNKLKFDALAEAAKKIHDADLAAKRSEYSKLGEASSAFDWKNYKSDTPKKPGELTGHESKKTSTGTVYTKKSPKSGDNDKEDVNEAMSTQQTHDFNRMMYGAIGKKEYLEKWGKNKTKKAPTKSVLNVGSIKPAEAKKVNEEQIDELSKTTLGSYIRKATAKAGHHGFHGGQAFAKGKFDVAKKQAEKEIKRISGVSSAASKLEKEETEQIDELLGFKSPEQKRQEVAKKASAEFAARKTEREKQASASKPQAWGTHYHDVTTKRGAVAPQNEEDLKEDEQLDEISPTLAKSYISKASGKPAGTLQKTVKRFGSIERARDVVHRDELKKIGNKFQKSLQTEDEQLDERELTKGETKEKEHLVKSMKKNIKGFKSRYGSRGKEVMYASATKMAKEETEQIEEADTLSKAVTNMIKSDDPRKAKRAANILISRASKSPDSLAGKFGKMTAKSRGQVVKVAKIIQKTKKDND